MSRNASVSTYIRRVGLLTIDSLERTGWLCQYLRPSHSLLDAILAWVTGSIGSNSSLTAGIFSNMCCGGGVGPPRTTDDKKPASTRALESARCRFEFGIDVRASRALLAFERCEQTCARLTSDIVACSEMCADIKTSRNPLFQWPDSSPGVVETIDRMTEMEQAAPTTVLKLFRERPDQVSVLYPYE